MLHAALRPSAAALLALTALAVSACGSGSGSGGADDGPARYAPATAPAGTALCSALFVESDPDPGGATNPDHETAAVWGDASLPDPWRGPLVVISQRDADAFYSHDDARAVRFGGHRADVAPIPVFQGVSVAALGHIVTWRTGPGRVVEVTVRDATAAEAVRLASAVRFRDGRPRLPVRTLGERTQPIHEEGPPTSLAGTWTLQYVGGAYGDGGLLTVDGRPTTADDLELLRLYALSSEATTVAGGPGVRLTQWDPAKGPFTVAWHTDDGQTVTVTGLGLSEEAVSDAVAGAHELSEDEWRALVAQAGTEGCLPAETETAP